MGGHTTDGPCDSCATEVEFGPLIGIEPFADHPGLVPTSGTKSGLECFTGRDRNGLKRALDDIDWVRQLKRLNQSRSHKRCTNRRHRYPFGTFDA